MITIIAKYDRSSKKNGENHLTDDIYKDVKFWNLDACVLIKKKKKKNTIE